MKNKKTLIITSLICLLPMLVGAAVYSRLPETVATPKAVKAGTAVHFLLSTLLERKSTN